MGRKGIAVLLVCFLLSGCGRMDGYLSMQPYKKQVAYSVRGDFSASTSSDLLSVLQKMVDYGMESAIIDVSKYDQKALKENAESTIYFVTNEDPLGAYAVRSIDYEIGTGGGKPAMSVEIQYRRSREDLSKISEAEDMQSARELIFQAMADCSPSVVVQVDQYEPVDLVRLIQQYALENPDIVMEEPEVMANVYPSTGTRRIIEIRFKYANSWESLRKMQNEVRPFFDAAMLYVSGGSSDEQKYTQLFSFLMERFNYSIETSATPAYSLICNSTGDSKAFAMVYASMCHRVGLECEVISGARKDEPRSWNRIKIGEEYYYLDLLQSNEEGYFHKLSNAGMEDYYWDASKYPDPEAAP